MDLDDIPLPSLATPVGETAIKDECKDPVASQFAFVGLGQGGGRMAEAFYKLGYRRVVAINTTATDLETLELPEANKLNLSTGGAGKSLEAARHTAELSREDIAVFLDKFLANVPGQQIFICFGMGGGTGAGLSFSVADAARLYGDIRAIVAWPKSSEGGLPLQNAQTIALELKERPAFYASTLLIDNDRVRTLYRPSVTGEYRTGNTVLAKLLHTFNTLAIQPTRHIAFDRADFRHLLSGCTEFGSQAITDVSSRMAIATAIRSAADALLAPVTLATAKSAALIFVGGKETLDSVPSDLLDVAFDGFSRLTGNNTVFRGIYEVEQPGLAAIFGAGQLDWPY